VGLSIEANVYLLHILNLIGVHLCLLKLMFNGTRGSGVPRNFFGGGGGNKFGTPLTRGEIKLGVKMWTATCTDSVVSA
jgi:hypothetical protein